MLLSRLLATPRLLPPRIWKDQGTQYVLVRHTVAVREVSRTVSNIIFSEEAALEQCRHVYPPTYYYGMDGLNRMRNLQGNELERGRHKQCL